MNQIVFYFYQDNEQLIFFDFLVYMINCYLMKIIMILIINQELIMILILICLFDIILYINVGYGNIHRRFFINLTSFIMFYIELEYLGNVHIIIKICLCRINVNLL